VDRLSGLSGVNRVETKAETGSVLVLFDGERFDEEQFLETARREELLLIEDEAPSSVPANAGSAPREPSGALAWGVWNHGNRAVARITGGIFDLGSLIPLAMVIWAIRQIALERPLARTPWYTLLWYAYGIFTKFHPGPKPGAEPTPPPEGREA
jgi:hypothetical protein